MKIVIASDAKHPNATYRAALLAAGALPEEVVIVSPGDPDPGPFDGLLLAGGADIDPARYGDSAATPTLDLDPERDALDFSLVTAAETGAVPIFGICRGFQALNVALGGTLFQDLPSQRARGISHDVENESRTSKDRAHVIRGRPGDRGSPFAGAVAALAGCQVNSRHHQGIKDLAPGLTPLAAAPDDLIEAFERTGGSFLAAVQWHPEDLVSEPGQKALFEAFLDAGRAHARMSSPAGGPLVEVSLEGALAVVKLARPAARNAFAGNMAGMLADTVAALAEDPTVPAIVLTGAGEAFSSGLDPDLLAALLSLGDEPGFAAHLDALGSAVRALVSAPRPILAAIDGLAAGAGFALALACDQRIARANPPNEAVFGLSQLFPALDAGASVLLPLLAPRSAAVHVAFGGETLGAVASMELGLVDLLAEDGSAVKLALRRAAQYADRPTASLASAKRALSSPDLLARLDEGLARVRDFAISSFRDGTLAASLTAALASSRTLSGQAPTGSDRDRPQ